eukprot:TRINITY_DN3153_c0_g1_i1.p2 TRINITY_DN3153_c0_g1~~TRINITY_DN3153_c0_g1_i1.p2  ORF type:complete len:301 (+),score=81.91 TRINITY_DN3153_c0_g1_i1:40-942(+)
MGNGAGLAAAATDPLVEADIKAKLDRLSRRELELIKERLSSLPEISLEHKKHKLEDLLEIAKQLKHDNLTEEETASLEKKLAEIDSEQFGLISVDDLAVLLDTVGLKLNDEEVQAKLQAAGIDRSTKTYMHKFRVMMSAPIRSDSCEAAADSDALKNSDTCKESADSDAPKSADACKEAAAADSDAPKNSDTCKELAASEGKRPKKVERLATTEDLLAVAREAKETLSSEDVICLEESFKSIDRDNDGFISPDELKIALEAIQVVMNEAEVLDMFALVDVDSNKQLDSEEYKTFVAISLT